MIVNLLTHAPATVAVSSTVDSKKFLPEHIVDGKKDTAWNSAPGDTHAWIRFRVPANAHVEDIKLTVGFTKGHWFEQNLRIEKVSVRHNGKTTPATLDPKSTELQTIAVDSDGGDYEIAIDQTMPGTNKDWNEIVVSELEVWGSVPNPVEAATPPRVIVGSLDIDCPGALKLKGGILSASYADSLCIVVQGEKRKERAEHTTTIAWIVGDHVADKISHTFGGDEGHYEVDDFKLGDERALLIGQRELYSGEMTFSERSEYTLYRVNRGRFDPIAAYDQTGQGAEMFGETHKCTLAVGKPGKPMPELVLTCVDEKSGFEAKDNTKSTNVMKLKWKGTAYDVPAAAHIAPWTPP
ncbi:MAG: hypothetical protein QM831_33130 [Kofleriaceae bacterium]